MFAPVAVRVVLCPQKMVGLLLTERLTALTKNEEVLVELQLPADRTYVKVLIPIAAREGVSTPLLALIQEVKPLKKVPPDGFV